jgi:dipeptidase
MGSDMVVALPSATADGVALFGQNCTRRSSQGVALRREPGRPYPLGENVCLRSLKLPQARQTCAVLGVHPVGEWGFLGGINDQHVAVGQTAIRTRLAAPQAGLTGCELVRLALERGSSARQAVDCLTGLVTRYGQGDNGDDHAFLVADGGEAFVVETAGSHWAVQAIGAVRAVSEVCLVRQDWDRLSQGLADLAISNNWWPYDGSKLNFAGVVAPNSMDHAAALRRWGMATLLLEQQNGSINAAFVRALLCGRAELASDEETLSPAVMERSLCRYPLDADSPTTTASFFIEAKTPEMPALAWCAFGPPGLSVYFPIFVDADLPPAFQERTDEGSVLWRRLMQLASHRGDAEQRALIREGLAELQLRFDHQAKETLAEATNLKKQGDATGVQRLLWSFMQANVERFEEFWSARVEPAANRPSALRGPTRPFAETPRESARM